MNRHQAEGQWTGKVMLGFLLFGVVAGVGAYRSRHVAGPSPAPGSIVAFSLDAAEQALRSDQPDAAEARCLGHITRLVGMVFDPASHDLILVGQADPGAPALSLDDFVVALRAVCLRDTWPAVSIDRTPKTHRTGQQRVRLRGGIEDSHFGEQLVSADSVLKKIALGLLPMDGIGSSYFAQALTEAQGPHGGSHIGSRFWFVPLQQALARNEDVFAIMDLQIGVQTEVLSVDGKAVSKASQVHDTIGDNFAHALTGHFLVLAARYPEIGRLKPLLDLTAIAHGIQSLQTGGAPPNLDYWLKAYRVERRETARTYPLLTNRALLHRGGRSLTMELDGGVELKALMLRLHRGDVTALREIVRRSRPRPAALTWVVPVADWRLPGMAPAKPGAEAPINIGSLGASVTRRLVPEGQSPQEQEEPDTPPLPRYKPLTMSTDRLLDRRSLIDQSFTDLHEKLYGGKTMIEQHQDPANRPTTVEQHQDPANRPTMVEQFQSSFGSSTGGASSNPTTPTWQGSSGGMLFGQYTEPSHDGRLFEKITYSQGNDYSPVQGYTVRWAVYDKAHPGLPIGTFDYKPELLDGGKIKVLTTPGQMRMLSLGWQGRDPTYTTYDADELYQKFVSTPEGQYAEKQMREQQEFSQKLKGQLSEKAASGISAPGPADLPRQPANQPTITPAVPSFPGSRPGGVLIKIKPRRAARAGAAAQREVLGSRPAPNSLSWPVRVPVGRGSTSVSR